MLLSAFKRQRFYYFFSSQDLFWQSQFLEVNNNTLGYFAKDSEIDQRTGAIHDNLSGMQTFAIILDSGIEGTFLKVKYLEDVRQLQQFIEQRKVFDKSFSFTDFIMLPIVWLSVKFSH